MKSRQNQGVHRAQPPGDRRLVIGSASAAPLTRAQHAFNRLIRKIEGLRRSIREETDRMNRLLDVYSSEIHPLETRVIGRRKSLARLLHPHLGSEAFSRRADRLALREILVAQLNLIVEVEGMFQDEDLKAMWEALVREDQGEKGNEDEANETEGGPPEFDGFTDRVRAEFEAMGIHVDLSRFRPGMSAAEFMAELAALESEIRPGGNPGAHSGPRRKPQRESQVQKRARLDEELRQRDLGVLYKQLAKMLHPDLERDPGLRVKKEVAMKELTTAYRKKDLHALLRLELEWISRETVDVARLTEEKLRGYNGILKGQVADLERQLSEVPRYPRFQFLSRFMHPLYGHRRLDTRSVKMELLRELGVLSRQTDALGSSGATREVRKLIRSFRAEERRSGESWF